MDSQVSGVPPLEVSVSFALCRFDFMLFVTLENWRQEVRQESEIPTIQKVYSPPPDAPRAVLILPDRSVPLLWPIFGAK